ncbi:S8 family peptidase [Pseudaquabacterium rugosum]|uniref:S8 family serine peptidase n=1 Tax=Pseudaquabacterium rugosum TaxID=2984194 RepID=A0ABU9BCI6_9BURK
MTDALPHPHRPRIDLNLADAQDLVDLGLSPEEAERLRASRPHYQLEDAAIQAGLSDPASARLAAGCVISPLSWVDPSTGTVRTLQADPAEWVIDSPPPAHDDAEAATVTGPGRQRAAPVTRRRPRCMRQPTPPRRQDIESMDGVAFPAFVDERHQRCYLHPGYVMVQARVDVEDLQLQSLLRTLDLRPVHVSAARGLFVAALGDGRHGLAALSSALMALNAAPSIELAEPAWLGFDDVEPQAEAHAPDRLAVNPPDATTAASGTAPAEATENPDLPWHLALLRAQAWPSREAGDAAIHLACVDSGAALDHPCLSAPDPSAHRAVLDFSGDGPDDALGHGTSVASMLVGNGHDGIRGLAPGCSLTVLKVELQASPLSYASRRAALLSLLPRLQAGERWVVNISWRTAGDVGLIRSAIEALDAAGALVVCSSGNEGRTDGSGHFPSDYASTLSVGAVDAQGRRAAYSNVSPQVDLMGPGGTVQQPLRCGVPGGGTAARTGTSFAAPQVAAIAARLWARRPELPAAHIRRWIEDSARTLDGQRIPDLQALRLLATDGAPTPAPTPIPAPQPSSPPRPPQAPPPPALPPAPGPASGAHPAPAPAPTTAPTTAGAGNMPFPLSGIELLVRCAACGIRPITARILARRPRVAGWDDLAAVLGMDAPTLDRIRATLHVDA